MNLTDLYLNNNIWQYVTHMSVSIRNESRYNDISLLREIIGAPDAITGKPYAITLYLACPIDIYDKIKVEYSKIFFKLLITDLKTSMRFDKKYVEINNATVTWKRIENNKAIVELFVESYKIY